ncbi:hypothetical protein GCG54_00014292 [Colletotrichum gloeosporioides]|uniref:Uncharacterized protein n=1 Tax=Colletotrichum gloeosporioides TaxID=474922 RepID=A0A8H4CEP3_COLGL|nr:uncharacterized protein GCG54_00014292 [Colletotrichum gloeosporioides]KAF3802585.1 hypothetical protein GCG54_00014292 [Colletotrichum gloeosporioides]
MGFKIIIVGGSISGLSLANTLEIFNIALRHSAQGGNSALETAGVLVNHLWRKMNPTSPGESLTEDEIEAVFREVQATCFSRVSAAVDQGRRTCSVSMKDTILSWFLWTHSSLGSGRV